MTIYGTELQFKIPSGVDAIAFGDQFDAATKGLGASQGFYSIDAALSGDDMFVLVGVNVPDDADPQAFFNTAMNQALIPALITAGAEPEGIKATANQTAMAFA